MNDRPESPDPPPSTLIHVQRAREGDQDAWWRVDEKIRPMLLEKFRDELLPRGLTLEDVIQDVLLTVLKSFARFEIQPGSDFRAWVIRRTQDRIKDVWRRARALKRGGDWKQVADGSIAMSLLGNLEANREDSQSMVMRQQEFAVRYDQAFRSLSEEQRMVVELRLQQDLSFEEIASRVGRKKAVTVRGVFFRAKDRLRKELGSLIAGDAD